MSENKTKHITSVGGQALMEGIMMRGPRGTAMSVRKSDGTITTKYKNFKQLKEKHKILGFPLIRGVVGFIESLRLGYSCLMESAELSGMYEELEEEEPSKFEAWIEKVFGEKFFSIITVVATVLGVALAIALFMWLPSVAFNGVNYVFKNVFMTDISILRAVIEGIIRITVFVIYIALTSRMKEIHRVFEYHGAEHKTIFCYENGEELTVENVKKQTRFHPRCGTSFIFVIMIISIIFSSLLNYFTTLASSALVWTLVKILMLPVVMGIGYEFIKYAGRHNNLFVRILSAPGLWMQRLTTKEPDDGAIEVGIEALKAVITDNPEDDKA